MRPICPTNRRFPSPVGAGQAIQFGLAVLALAIVFMLPIGGELEARPFRLFGPRCPAGGQCLPSEPFSQPIPPPVTGPSPESKEVDHPVQQPWLLLDQTELISLQQPDTALEPVPGTGSKLPIGGKLPGEIGLKLDPATLDALKKLLAGTSLPSQPVPITLPVEPQTSERLSRILMILEGLAWLGGVTFGGSFLGKLLPLVVQVANGLRSAIPAPLPAPQPIAAATSSPPAKT